MQDKMLLISFNVLNSCLPCKDSPLSTTEDPFSQTNNFNRLSTSITPRSPYLRLWRQKPKKLKLYLWPRVGSINEHVTKIISDCMHRLIRINRIKYLLGWKTLPLPVRSIMGCSRGTRSLFTRAFRAKRELQFIFLGKKEIIITSKQGTTTFFPITIFF